MKKISLRKKMAVTAILSPIIVIGIVFYVVMPTISDIVNMKNNIEAQRLDLEKKYQKGQSLKKLNENLNIIEPQLEKLDKLFIRRGEVLEFITTLEGIAEKSNIDQKINLDLNLGVDENDYKKTPVQISAIGSFMNQLNYLLSVEALSYYVNIKSFSMNSASAYSSPEGPDAKDSVNTLIFADTYWK